MVIKRQNISPVQYKIDKYPKQIFLCVELHENVEDDVRIKNRNMAGFLTLGFKTDQLFFARPIVLH